MAIIIRILFVDEVMHSAGMRRGMIASVIAGSERVRIKNGEVIKTSYRIKWPSAINGFISVYDNEIKFDSYLSGLEELIKKRGAIATAEFIGISPTRLRKVLKLKAAPSSTMNKITNTIDLLK